VTLFRRNQRGRTVLRTLRDAGRVAANPVRFLESLRGAEGDVVVRHLLGRRAVVVMRPELVEDVLLTQATRFTKGFRKLRATAPSGQGLLTSEGETWLRQRRMMQPAFQPRFVEALVPRVLAAAEAAVGAWALDAPVDLGHAAQGVAREVFLATLARPDTALDIGLLAREFHTLGRLLEWRVKIPVQLPGWAPLPSLHRFEASQRRVRAFIRQLLAEERQADAPDAGMLARILAARDASGEPMAERAIEDEVFSLFLAGHETSALTLAFALHLLAHHPAVQDEAAAELDAVTGGAPLAPEHLGRLTHVRAIVAETLRLYPPVFVMVREALAAARVGPVPVRTGDLVLLPQWLIHRDARFFEAPEAFVPARWTREFERGLPRLAYFPFGGGARLCIGNQAALVEIAAMLAVCLQRFHVAPLSPLVPKLGGAIVLRPLRPLRVALTPRG
jgi:cytochrome P450